jgi:hypothetical protein
MYITTTDDLEIRMDIETLCDASIDYKTYCRIAGIPADPNHAAILHLYSKKLVDLKYIHECCDTYGVEVESQYHPYAQLLVDTYKISIPGNLRYRTDHGETDAVKIFCRNSESITHIATLMSICQYIDVTEDFDGFVLNVDKFDCDSEETQRFKSLEALNAAMFVLQYIKTCSTSPLEELHGSDTSLLAFNSKVLNLHRFVTGNASLLKTLYIENPGIDVDKLTTDREYTVEKLLPYVDLVKYRTRFNHKYQSLFCSDRDVQAALVYEFYCVYGVSALKFDAGESFTERVKQCLYSLMPYVDAKTYRSRVKTCGTLRITECIPSPALFKFLNELRAVEYVKSNNGLSINVVLHPIYQQILPEYILEKHNTERNTRITLTKKQCGVTSSRILSTNYVDRLSHNSESTEDEIDVGY